ncbi:MAG TPA: hypothetical protein VK337_06955 [Xanthobacteraceae bacterium]|nr:hypothetical protein [Xanthobacteraceae bacterium]
MLTELVEYNDIAFVEPRRDSSIIVNIAAQFSLSDRRNRRGERRVFQCRAVYLSTRAICLVTPVEVKAGDRVIAHIGRLGRFEGVVKHVMERGFLMGISTPEKERDKLADKIEWLEKHKNHDVADRRIVSRVAPTNLYSRVTLPDGGSETCLVVDISDSGAALMAETAPEIGTVLVIGKLVAHVVRHLDDGFAVQFIGRQNATM